MVPSSSYNPAISFTRTPSTTPGEAVEPVRFSYPFHDLKPLRSHVFPHFIVVRAAQQWLRHPFAYDDNADRVLGKQADLTESEASLLMGRIRCFYRMWVFDTEKLSGRTAPHWLSPLCDHQEGIESRTGRRRSGLDTPCGSEADRKPSLGGDTATEDVQEAGEDASAVDDEEDEDEEDDGPRPDIPGVLEADPDIRVLQWIGHSNAHLSSQKVSLSH
jgi:hypothetical protein